MTPNRHRSGVIEFPNDLEILVIREFDAPIELVFEVFTKPERVRKTFAPFGEEVKVCSIDLRVGGSYHLVFVTHEGTECSFRGTYLQIEPPTRSVQTWLFDGWPNAPAVESMVLRAKNGVTEVSYSLAFRDNAGRDHMTKYDGLTANLDNVEARLRTLLDAKGVVSR